MEPKRCSPVDSLPKLPTEAVSVLMMARGAMKKIIADEEVLRSARMIGDFFENVKERKKSEKRDPPACNKK